MQPMRRTLRASGVLGAALLLLAGVSARGQFVVDRGNRSILPPGTVAPGRSYDVRAVEVDARLRDGVAEVRVTQTFHNPGSTAIEAEYLFPLPDESAIGDLILMVDGQELPGRVLPKAEARSIYEGIVRSKRDPALLEYMGQGLYRASVFPIPAGADRVVTLRYTQVCRRERDVIEFLFPLAIQKQAGRPIGKLDLSVRVAGSSPIKSVYSPSYDVRVDRPGEREAVATLNLPNVVPTSDFRLVVALGEGAVGASLLSYRPTDGEDGYFLLLASPLVRSIEAKPLPKTVVFVLDRSGSMAGKKLDQAKGALQFVLDNLRDDDTFNIVTYDDGVDTYKPELQRYNPAARAEATRFVANIRTGGGTNINGGLTTALGQIGDDSRPAYVLFLTDGLATAGERSELRISENARAANKGRARVFSFGVGFDVNARLLDRVSGGSGGTSEYVRPDEDIEAHVGAFYAKLTRPALAGMTIDLAGLDVNRTYPRDLPDLFEGGQIAWVGRYPRSGATSIRISGKVGGERQTFEFPAELAGAGSGSGREYVARLWAVRRIGFIIDQIDLNGPNPELTDELVALSTRYGILTPYTSFLADERVPLHARADNAKEATVYLNALQDTQGASGIMQRRAKQSLSQANRLKEEDLAQLDSRLTNITPAAPGSPAAQPFPTRGYVNIPSDKAAQDATKPGSSPVAVVSKKSVIRDIRNEAAANPAPARSSQASATPGMGMGMARGLGPDGGPTDAASNLRRIGTKTFFRKEGRWVDSEVKPEDEGKAVALEQFSAGFFDLAARQTAEQNQYLAFDEPVTVRIADRVYRIDPPRAQ